MRFYFSTSLRFDSKPPLWEFWLRCSCQLKMNWRQLFWPRFFISSFQLSNLIGLFQKKWNDFNIFFKQLLFEKLWSFLLKNFFFVVCSEYSSFCISFKTILCQTRCFCYKTFVLCIKVFLAPQNLLKKMWTTPQKTRITRNLQYSSSVFF